MPGDPNRPASEKQISALRKFGAKIPDSGLTISVAAEWMDYLIKKVQTGRQLDDKDRSGPPNFHPAASPSSSPPPAAKPAPAAAPPAPSPPPNGHDNGSPDPLPTSEGWITAQVQVVRDAIRVTDELLEAMLEAERTGHVRRKYVSPDPAQDVWELTEKGRLLAQSAEN